MSATCPRKVPSANKQSGIGIPKFSLRIAIMRVAHRLSPIKPELFLAEHAGVGERACRAWGNGATMSLSAFDNLLGSKYGFLFLTALMERRRPVPDWWRNLRDAVEISELVKRQQALRDEIERAKESAG